jgi:amino acid adenylation domain-containing protein
LSELDCRIDNKLPYSFNNTKVNYQEELVIQEFFEERVSKALNETSLVFKNKKLTYEDLNRKSNQLARKLRQKGVKPNTIVAIMVKRSFEMIIGILAIIKAGGAYLPIDPDYPETRIKYILEDSDTKLLLTQNELTDKANSDCETLFIQDQELSDIDTSNLVSINSSNDLIYVIYTSGSTGNPKGVMIEHRSVNNFIKGVTDVIEFSSQNTILALTTISFDIFVLETLLSLIKGLKVIIADENQQRDPKLLNEVILKNNVDMLQITPSRLKLLMTGAKSISCLKELKVIMVGGEQFPQNLLDELKKVTNAKIYNMYGPTETTVWSTIKDLTDCDKVNIGRPIANTRVYILNNKDKLANIGEDGELYIAGDGLARGYLNGLNLTEEKFISNSYEIGRRIYKTGDLSRWLQNGELECLGRIDDQVKIRGYRVELGEIENYFGKYDGMHDCVVAAKKNIFGDEYLIAYYISHSEIIVSEVMEYLRMY